MKKTKSKSSAAKEKRKAEEERQEHENFARAILQKLHYFNDIKN